MSGGNVTTFPRLLKEAHVSASLGQRRSVRCPQYYFLINAGDEAKQENNSVLIFFANTTAPLSSSYNLSGLTCFLLFKGVSCRSMRVGFTDNGDKETNNSNQGVGVPVAFACVDCVFCFPVCQVMNDVVFPTRLDFGVHALGETIRRTVKMVCKVRRCSCTRISHGRIQQYCESTISQRVRGVS